MTLRKHWWKALAVTLIGYSIIAGFLNDVPRLFVLNETIRNLFYHVSMWFAMLAMLTISLVYSIMHLSGGKLKYDNNARIFADVGLLFAVLGLTTGMIWAKFTWGAYWTNDPKLNGSAITLLVYIAYFILRGSLIDRDKRGTVSAVYNIFAFVLMIVFIGILPRMTDSLHPGNGGNPGFNQYDLDSGLRAVFYPAVLGWILFGIWMAQLQIRSNKVREQIEELEDNNIHETLV